MPSLEVFASPRVVGRKNIFGLAKSSLKRHIATCQRKILRLGHRHARIRHQPLVATESAAASPRVEQIFKKFAQSQKIKIDKKMKISDVMEKTPIVLPYLMVRSDVRGNYELHCDHMEFLVEHILAGCRGVRISGDIVAFQLDNATHIFKTIVSRVAGIKELVLDTAANALLMQTIVEFYQVVNDSASQPKRFQLESFSVIGSTRINDMDVLSSMLMLTRRTLTCLRMRYCKLHSAEQSLRLWTAVSQCQRITQLQYEPYKIDVFSRPYLVDALLHKKMTSLILTDIEGLSHSDVLQMANSGYLTELAVIGEQIHPHLYSLPEAKKIVSNLDSLLIQLHDDYDLQDCKSRGAIVCALRHLSSTSLLEVIHSSRGTVADTARIISYWLQLADETERCVMLKLEDCTQEKQDAAVGRVLRKCRESQKAASNDNGISLCLNNGEVVVLDKKTWFGDDL